MNDSAALPVEIPYAALSDTALHGIEEAYVLREGTEYGERDYSLAEKVAQVLRQIERGDARILFDPDSATVAVVSVATTGVVKPDSNKAGVD